MEDFRIIIYEAEDAYLEYHRKTTACELEQEWLAQLLNNKPIKDECTDDELAAFILANTIVRIAKAAGVGLKTAKDIFMDTLYEVHKRHMIERWEKRKSWQED